MKAFLKMSSPQKKLSWKVIQKHCCKRYYQPKTVINKDITLQISSLTLAIFVRSYIEPNNKKKPDEGSI